MTTLAVAIATTGRPDVLSETLRELNRQTIAPDRVVVCPAKDADVEQAALSALPFAVTIVPAVAPGLAAQRNVLLRTLEATDLVLFIDDDFLLAPTYLAELRALFAARPDCTIATGFVVADGAVNRGYDVPEGRAILAAHVARAPTQSPCFNAYGCNMALRWSALRGHCTFDVGAAALRLGRGRGLLPPGGAATVRCSGTRPWPACTSPPSMGGCRACASAIRRSPTRSTSPAKAR